MTFYIHLDFSVSRRLLCWGIAALLLPVCAVELNSENITLSTYFPAPSGFYTRVLTTGDTYLDTDGGNKLSIGTSNTSTAYALEVNGSTPAIKSDGDIVVAGNSIIFDANPAMGASYAEIIGIGDDLMFLTPNSSSRRMVVNGTGVVLIGKASQDASTPTNFLLEVGDGSTNGTIVARQSATACTPMSAASDPIICPAGDYATTMAGYFSEYASAGFSGANPAMLCCHCNGIAGGGTCPTVP